MFLLEFRPSSRSLQCHPATTCTSAAPRPRTSLSAAEFVTTPSQRSIPPNFPCDFPVPEAAHGVINAMFSAPGFYCVVAESNGQIPGSNCLDERAIIHGIGPVTVNPHTQNRGVGRKLIYNEPRGAWLPSI
jgi:hypothetical protein